MIAAISFALALFLSTALVPVAVRYAGVLGLVDEPDERKVHAAPIPRAGGIAITFAFFIPALFWLSDVSSLTGLLAGAAIIAIFGFFDDRHDLDYKWKFLGQILGVAVFLAGNVEITKTPFLGFGDLAPWLSYPILALFILGVTNAVNLSDGLDGLAAGSSLLSLAFIAFLAYTATEYSLAIIAVSAMGALIGFLRFNTHPATVFMGDTGSQFLGYITGCLAVMVTQSSYLPVSPMLAIVIVGVPILDTLMVMLLRLRDGNSPFKPDQRHLHHQFLAIGLHHYQSVAALYLVNFLLLAMAFFIRYQSDIVVLLAYLLFCAATLAVIAFLKNSAFSLRRRKSHDENQERRNPWFRRLHWFHQHGAVLIQYILGFLWIVLMFVGDHHLGIFDLLVAGALIGALVYWRLFEGNNRLLARLIFYFASVLAVYMQVYQMDIQLPGWRALTLLDGPLIVLVIALSLAVRTTRRDHFRMDNQDMLVLLMLLAAPLLTTGGGDSNILIGAIVRLAIFLYAAEYVITRIERPVAGTAMASIAFVSYLVVGAI